MNQIVNSENLLDMIESFPTLRMEANNKNIGLGFNFDISHQNLRDLISMYNLNNSEWRISESCSGTVLYIKSGEPEDWDI